MSGYGTKKPFGDTAVQLTFPLNFQRAYDMPFAYYEDAPTQPLDIMVGTDFQSQYHQEKRQYANKTVMDGLQARRTAERKLLTGVHNYHLPKPVLGQRKFANPMNGVVGFSSARRDDRDAPFQTIETGMTGGVVTTAEGQQFYKKQLADRINQLNRMNALAQGFAVEMGQSVRTYDNKDYGPEEKIKFFALFDELLARLGAGEYKLIDFAKIRTMLLELFKAIPSFTVEDFDDVIRSLSVYLPALRADYGSNLLLAENEEGYSPIFTLTVGYIERMFTYVREMAKAVYAPISEKKRLAKNLIETVFKGLQKERNFLTALRELAQDDDRVMDEVEDFDAVFGDDGEDGDDGRFDRPANAREDGEQYNAPRAPMAGRNDDPNRQRFGQRNGMIIYGGPSYFGEAEARDEQVDLVAPLNMAGFDPNADGDIFPTPDPITLKEAVEDEIKIVLEPLGFVEGGDATVEQILEVNYGANPSRFVKEVVDGLTEKGFTPAQIAKGMEQLDMNVFGEYIAENTGPTGPAKAEPARRFNPLTAVTSTTGTGDDRRERFFGTDFPRSREELRAEFKTYDALYKLGASIPQEFGGPYLPRRNTDIKNIQNRIIRIVADNVDPQY